MLMQSHTFRLAGRRWGIEKKKKRIAHANIAGDLQLALRWGLKPIGEKWGKTVEEEGSISE